MSETVLTAHEEQTPEKLIKKPEFILYLAAIFFYTNMTGMVGSYRAAYLVNVLHLASNHVSFYNAFLSVSGFFLHFFIAMYIDSRKVGKSGKFRPLIAFATIPMALFLVLTFYTPSFISGALLMPWLLFIATGFSVANMFAGTLNNVAWVMTPNMKERDNVMSFRSISSAVGNSAPLIIILVIGLLIKTEGTQYIVCSCLCAAVGIATMLPGVKIVRERVAYSNEKKNPIVGFADVLKNKYAWTIIVSEFLKSFRNISTYFGPFLAAALLGSTSKYLLFGLPTGIGTAVGMLVINFLLKKFNSKVLYIASNIYSVIINTIAFIVGYIYFHHNTPVLQIVFIAFLFLIGLQFGASNLLPSMFQADVLESLELETGKRLDASLPFVIGIGTLISGTIATALAPIIHYGSNPLLSVVHYIQPTDAIPNPVQSMHAKIAMLFFYTVFHGLMMFLCCIPFFFYKLTGQTKEDIHARVLERRTEIENAENGTEN